MPAPARKKQDNTDKERMCKLEQARLLHENITRRMSIAGLTHQDIKKDVCIARTYVRKSNRSGRN